MTIFSPAAFASHSPATFDQTVPLRHAEILQTHAPTRHLRPGSARFRYSMLAPRPTQTPLRRDRERRLAIENNPDQPQPVVIDDDTLNTLLDYANICNTNVSRQALMDSWAYLTSCDTESAKNDVDRIDHNLRTIFLNTPPQGRPAEWLRLSPFAQHDLNLMVDLGEIVRASDRPAFGAPHDIGIHLKVAQTLAKSSRADPDTTLRTTDAPYLMSLANYLRKYNAVNDPYFQNRLEIMPGDVRAYVQGALPDAPAGLTDSAYLLRRESDLCALLYRWLSDRCSTAKDGLLTLASLRMTFEGAVLAEAKDHVFLTGMFSYSGDDDAIFHDGLVLRNGGGKNVEDLAAYRTFMAHPAFRNCICITKKR